MYQITDSVLKNGVYSAFAAQTREFCHRLSFGEGFGENFIKQTSFEEGITKIEISQEGNDDSSGLVFGSCCASSCVAEFYNPDKTFNYNKKTLFVECGIKYPVEISYESKAGGYYLTDNGKWVSSEGYYIKVTNLIPVFEGDKFQYTGRGEWGGASVIWYDTDKKYLSGSEYANEETRDHVATVVIEAPEGAAWAMFQTFDFDEDVTLEVSKLNDSFFYIPCGYYKVDKPETDDDWHTVKVTAYDAVDDMTAKWNTNITFPTNAYILLDSTVEKHNLELDIESDVLAELRSRTVTQEEALTLTAYTEREVCGFLAGLVGANARVNTAGKLAVRRYQYFSTDDFNIPANVQWQNGFKKTAEEEFMIHSVTSGIDDAVFTAGTGAGISFANPIITEDEITTIYGLYAGISFQPSSCEWRGNPCVECGDTVIVTDKSGNSYTVFVASQDIDLTGGLSMHTHCPSGDADISFDTVDERTRAALNRQYTALQQAIIDASNAINGALGGHYEVVDSDNDGNPDGWFIKQYQDGTGGLIRANYEGIGLSSDGGVTYRTAITHKGINADEITVGTMSVERIDLNSLNSKIESAISKGVIAINGSSITGLTEEIEGIVSGKGYITSEDLSDYAKEDELTAIETELAGYALDKKLTLMTDEGIYTGSITAKQINVGWSGANYAADAVWEGETDYLSVSEDSSNSYLPKISMITAYEGEKQLKMSGAFYAATGAKILINCIAYPSGGTSNTSSFIGIGLDRASTANGSFSQKANESTNGKTLNTEHSLSIEYTVTEGGFFKLVTWFTKCNTSAYIRNITITQSVSGKMIVDGRIASSDGCTFFDLDSGLIHSENGSGYSTELSVGGIVSKYNDEETGGFRAADIHGIGTAIQILHFQNGLRIGEGKISNTDPILDCGYDSTIGEKVVTIYKSLFLKKKLQATGNIRCGFDDSKRIEMTADDSKGANLFFMNGTNYGYIYLSSDGTFKKCVNGSTTNL